MGQHRRQETRAKKLNRLDRLFIGPHTLKRVRERIEWKRAEEIAALRTWCVKIIYDGVGKQLLLFPKKSPAYQQVAQPVLQDSHVLGYFVLAPDREAERQIVVRTFLDPHARQILNASGGPMPPWYYAFQLRRRS